jgi:hypothetical protein
MIIAILVAAVITGACLGEVARLLDHRESERLKARQADARATHYAAVADSVTGSTVAISSVPATV